MSKLATAVRVIPNVFVTSHGQQNQATIAENYTKQELQDHINMILENTRYLLVHGYELDIGSFSIVHDADQKDSAVIKFHNHDIDKMRQDTGQNIEIPKNKPELLDQSWQRLNDFVKDLTAISKQVGAEELTDPEQEIRVGAAKFEDYLVLNQLIAHLAKNRGIGTSSHPIKRCGLNSGELRLHFELHKGHQFYMGDISDFTQDEVNLLPHSPQMIDDYLRQDHKQKTHMRVLSLPVRDISGMN